MSSNYDSTAASAAIPSFEEVEQLVQNLYRPGSPQDVAETQDRLQQLQRSPQGWQLADSLLQSQDDQVRFFGALTFTIKINIDWHDIAFGRSLDEGDAVSLLDRLLHWLVKLVAVGEGQLVLRKLCTSLVAYFLCPLASWDKSLRHLLCCFQAGSAVRTDALGQFPSTSDLIRRMDRLQTLTILWFATTLIEEVGKITPISAQTSVSLDRPLPSKK
ncbi:MAG: hypothetical protein LQ351_003677 [Letrouitia transgressa]|nr:MAG: hypothetical protein LQ351_003677 [Letrouitia transgressa]